MNRQQGPGQPLRNLTNTTQPRNTTPGSRLITSKSGAWGSNTSQPLPQPNDAASSWAQAMNPRSNNQPLDLSSSSFPSLAGGSVQAQAPGAPSSQWHSGPPAAREPSQPQSSRNIQQRQPPISSQRDQNYGSEFSSPIDQPSSRFQLPRGAPPGLAPIDGMSPDSTIQSRKTPTSQMVNGSIGQERTNGDQKSQSPTSAIQGQGRPKDMFAGPEPMSPITQQDQTMESLLSGLSEKDKWGMAGWQALHEGPGAEFKALTRQQDQAAFEHYSASGQPLLRTYTGPFAPPNAFPPRPLDTDYTIPDCYIVQNVAPIQQRISGFTEDTLFYIFYTSPKDIIQEEVATELMSRKWRFHMKEKMWLTRDDTTQNPQILEKDVCEQGYYIWWDYRNWKRIRKMYILRYEDLDDHLSGGRSLAMPGLFQGGFGPVGVMNGGSGTGPFNAVPGLERMAALGGRF
ncbi:transcriptional regulator [Lithohypha guttulata]|uniref:transcriptional regulator n=1 Tax=Lithohypha guttulata TaxID=1690604 RepID=UPI002DDFC2F0|nr:transcriptional regulator [Lithohypha guttulata]